ncbi:DUF6005 family protein [Bacillus suaedaesalsae]|uniref:Petrobactin biosynthesis protein AsbE n=1 Tax=Bacillus suaedaesalsae TaxID=2810349 RepID=A0ABS2DKA8_9BACI|nr:DUF6005 family protein [Bacillus suaedaesalsae]MBM6618935.1 Petrobactin biosynthesis protein AsbE [Bacillus suaedaesalsae]
MIKVHCFVSCVCEVIKKATDVDHRPYYFGVWDADFDITEKMELTYHSENISHDYFCKWYELLYGIRVKKWYDESISKQQNIEKLVEMMEEKESYRHVMVMLDLSKLPERENKFHQSPFPHYVMLETTDDPEEWFMFDPDFRWEGALPKERILAAIREPSVKGGYYFDAKEINQPTNETIEAYFNTCLKRSYNPMTEAVSSIIEAYTVGDRKHHLSELGNALKQLPVLAIRKYAYEHAFAYFANKISMEEMEFELWCDEIELLVKGYTTVQYRAMKLAMTSDYNQIPLIQNKLDEQNAREFKIKQGLVDCYNKWLLCEQVRAQ